MMHVVRVYVCMCQLDLSRMDVTTMLSADMEHGT